MSVVDDVNAYNGIENKLLKLGFPKHSNRGVKHYMVSYFKHKGYKKPRIPRSWMAELAMAPYIQNEFKEFIEYCKYNKDELIYGFKAQYPDIYKWYNIEPTKEEIENYLTICIECVDCAEPTQWVVGNKIVQIKEIRSMYIKCIVKYLKSVQLEKHRLEQQALLTKFESVLKRREKRYR